MASGAARYDGHSEFYDQHFGPGPRLRIRDVREFASSGVVLPRNIGLVAER